MNEGGKRIMQLSLKVQGEGSEYLSRLLAKNPNNIYDRDEKGNRVRLVFASSNENEAEAHIFVTPDPIELVRNSPSHYDITQYINDREFVVSSLFCSYIRSALGTALNGKPKEEFLSWVDHKFDMKLGFGPVATDYSNQMIKNLFEPLGYSVEIEELVSNYEFEMNRTKPARYIHLNGYMTVQYALRHLFVIIPVLDNFKHYFIDEREIEKLNNYGEGWLENHPLKDHIVERSLRFKDVIKKVNVPTVVVKEKKEGVQFETPKVRLNELRYDAITDKVKHLKSKERIVDLGSGEGKLSVRLATLHGIKEILAVEPSETAQLRALQRFEKIDKDRSFVIPTPVLGSLFYYDERLRGKDVMVLCEVIEHIDEFRLPSIMKNIFREYQPSTLVITTPNRDYNTVYDMNEAIRHKDHRFEWSRKEFNQWCENWSEEYPYSLQIEGIGDEHKEHGFPTQMCTFTRKEEGIK